MLKKLSSIAIFMSCAIYATEQSVAEYTGKVSNLYIGKSESIKVGVVHEEANELECDLNNSSEWSLYFEQGQPYSKNWLEILNLVRRTQETIRIGYLPNSNSRCSIEYLALLKGDGTDSTSGGIGDYLTRHGQYGNIALIYNNNLTESNYSASDHSGGDIAAAAFDGYIWQQQIDKNLGSLINRGIWVVEKDAQDTEKEYWLQVRFDDVVNVTGFRIMVNEKSVGLGRSPRSITVLTSIDGVDFTDNGSYVLSKAIDQRANLDSIIELKYLRIRVNSNYGNSYIEIDELEVYSDY
ncbi:discoidin domain-containing protein [Thalassotalea profundi]|uniref:F5/8 type C domain-containing protein n=1 Tax=Thalassotalea profundi TaxID=2036687 RepID=A0ABQ3IAG2_9GAMM|nr:discoidin domain-containing protein [Thalassotalea profundi]GHE76749.1 hypothetical protein GCM10011501_00060 [Thalassotalea profundi]